MVGQLQLSEHLMSKGWTKACAAILPTRASPAHADTGRAAVLATIHAFFDGLNRRDRSIMLSHVTPDGSSTRCATDGCCK